MAKFVALGYMDGFSCIGPDCEDNCCQLWHIPVDQSTYQRLKKAMSKEPSEAKHFDSTFTLMPLQYRKREHFAEIPQAVEGPCPMLDEKKLCRIHGKYGPEMLPSICDTFPRRQVVVGDRAELSGDLSCPEIARRALLPTDAAQVREVAQSVWGEPRLLRQLDPDKAPPYQAQLDEVRGTLFQLFGLGEYPLASRLYFAVSLAERVAPFFGADIKEANLPRLLEEIRTVEAPEARDALHEQFRSLPTDGPLATSLLAQALAARMIYARVPRVLKLLESTFSEYAATGGGVRSDGQGGFVLSPEPLWQDYRARWERLMAAHGERVERWFQNYCQHYAMHDWYVDSPTLLSYLQGLALKMALVRFILVAHPLVRQALTGPEAEAGPLLDRAVVEVVYTLARSFEHSPSFVAALSKILADTLGAPSTVALLKL